MSNAIATLSYMMTIDTKQFTAGVVATKKEMTDLRRMLGDTATAEEELAAKLARIDELRAKFTTVPEERWQRAIKAVRDEYEKTQIVQADLVDMPNAPDIKGFAGQQITDKLGLGGFIEAGSAAGPAGIAIAAGFATAAAGATAFIATAKVLSDVTLDAISRLDEIADSAQALGISASSFQQLQNAAMLADAPAEQLVNAMTKMEDVLASPPPQTLAMLDKLGLSFHALQEMQPDQAFLEIARAIDKLPNKSQQIGAMRDIFGKVDVTLLNLIDDVDTFVAAAEGLSLNDSQFDAIGDADASLKELNASFTHLKNVIGVELAPVVVEVAGHLSDFLQDDGTQQALLASLYMVRDTLLSIDEVARGVGQTFEDINIGETAQGLFESLTGNVFDSFSELAAANMEAAKLDREMKKKQKGMEPATSFGADAAGIGADVAAEMAEKADKAAKQQVELEQKRREQFAKSLADMQSEIQAAKSPMDRMVQDAIKAGARTQEEIDAYVKLAETIKDAKQAEDDLKKSQQDRAAQKKKDSADYLKYLDSLKTPEEKAADKLADFMRVGGTDADVDKMAGQLAEGMVKQVNQGPIVGVEKGSKEAMALEAARGREDRQLVVLKEIRQTLKDQLKQDAIEVREMIF